MGDELQGERIAVLETKVNALEKGSDTRATREWAIILVVLGLLITTIAKALGVAP